MTNDTQRSSPDIAFRASLTVTIALLLGLGTVAWHRVNERTPHIYPRVPAASSQLRSGRELLMVVFGANGCGASRAAEVVPDISQIRAQVKHYADTHGLRFATLGIALDPQPNDGLHFLLSFPEPFDEIEVGRNWLGLGATTYMFRDRPGAGSIPQVVLIEREVTVAGTSGISVGPDSVIARRIGVDALTQWATAGLTFSNRQRLEPVSAKSSTND